MALLLAWANRAEPLCFCLAGEIFSRPLCGRQSTSPNWRWRKLQASRVHVLRSEGGLGKPSRKDDCPNSSTTESISIALSGGTPDISGSHTSQSSKLPILPWVVGLTPSSGGAATRRPSSSEKRTAWQLGADGNMLRMSSSSSWKISLQLSGLEGKKLILLSSAAYQRWFWRVTHPLQIHAGVDYTYSKPQPAATPVFNQSWDPLDSWKSHNCWAQHDSCSPSGAGPHEPNHLITRAPGASQSCLTFRPCCSSRREAGTQAWIKSPASTTTRFHAPVWRPFQPRLGPDLTRLRRTMQPLSCLPDNSQDGKTAPTIKTVCIWPQTHCRSCSSMACLESAPMNIASCHPKAICCTHPRLFKEDVPEHGSKSLLLRDVSRVWQGAQMGTGFRDADHHRSYQFHRRARSSGVSGSGSGSGEERSALWFWTGMDWSSFWWTCGRRNDGGRDETHKASARRRSRQLLDMQREQQ